MLLFSFHPWLRQSFTNNVQGNGRTSKISTNNSQIILGRWLSCLFCSSISSKSSKFLQNHCFFFFFLSWCSVFTWDARISAGTSWIKIFWSLCLCLREARFHGEIKALVLALMLALMLALASLVKTRLYLHRVRSRAQFYIFTVCA